MGISVANRSGVPVNVMTMRKWWTPFPTAFIHVGDKRWNLRPGQTVNLCTAGAWTTVYVWEYTGESSCPTDTQLALMNTTKLAVKGALWIFLSVDGIMETLFGDFFMDWIVEMAIERRLREQVQGVLGNLRDAFNFWRAGNRADTIFSKCDVLYTVGLGILDRQVSVLTKAGKLVVEEGWFFQWSINPDL